jgi:hypothetical protein
MIIFKELATVRATYARDLSGHPGQNTLIAAVQGILTKPKIASDVVSWSLHCPEGLIIATIMVDEKLAASADVRNQILKEIFENLQVFDSVEVTMVQL